MGRFKKIRDKLFGEKKADSSPKAEAAKKVPAKLEKSKPKTVKSKPSSRDRDPYYIQIGLDFGTSFSKVICRDVVADKAWIFSPPGSNGKDLPFLIPSTVQVKQGSFSHSMISNGAYENNALYHIKMCLEAVAKKREDIAALGFAGRIATQTGMNVEALLEASAVYLLAGILGSVKTEIPKENPEQFSGNHPDDFLAVNMAVPVADADDAAVESLFNRVLRQAFVLADQFAGFPTMSIQEVLDRMEGCQEMIEKKEVTEACFIYPEVSANMQGFVRSRSSTPGIYLFSDTGAGTVDQSAFTFSRRDGEERLNYLHADVHPLGSSEIERLAATSFGKFTLPEIEKLRKAKESGQKVPRLERAKNEIHKQLAKASEKTFGKTWGKLNSKRQLCDLQIIFGGGGHSEFPYEGAVFEQFQNQTLFDPKELQRRKCRSLPFKVGVPHPTDLKLSKKSARWMPRLSVAYGLSFDRETLAQFVLPKDIPNPEPSQIWRGRPARVLRAPTHDDM